MFKQARDQGGRSGDEVLQMFRPPLKCVGNSLKNLGSSQKTFRTSWCPKLVTGLCSSKLMITSLTRSALSVISERRHSCSFPSAFTFLKGAVGERTSCSMLGNLNLKWPGLVVWQRLQIMRTEFFRGHHWCWKLRNYCETRNRAIVSTTRVLQ